MTRSTLLRVLVVLALFGAILAAYRVLPVQQVLTDFLQWVEGYGVWGPVLVAVAYVPATVLLVPGSLLTLGAGAVFGVVRGLVAVSAGSTVGAACSFLIGRTLARGWVERKVAGNPKFQAIDAAVAQQGFKIVFLLRLSPLFPFTLLNYALGLTRVPFRTYLLASWIGMLPGTLMYVYLGNAIGEVANLSAERGERSTTEQVFFYAGLAATVLVTVLITHAARRALTAAVPQEGAHD